MSKSVLLIEPPYYKLFGYDRWYYPQTITLVGTYFKKLGYEVNIYDGDVRDNNCRTLSRSELIRSFPKYYKNLENDKLPIWKDIRNAIKKYSPDILGISSISPKIESSRRVAEIAREEFGNNLKIILGGTHVQAMFQSNPKYKFNKIFDEVVPKIKNLIDRRPDINLIVNSEEYTPRDISCILTSVGCHNSCTYCCNSMNLDKKIEYRSIKYIEEELQDIANRFGDRVSIKVLDDNLILNMKRYHTIGNIMKKNKLKFRALTRVPPISRSMLKSFKEYGGDRLFVGVESGSQGILDEIRKNITIEEIIKKSKLINEEGVKWNAYIMVGFPFETLEDIKKTEKLMYKIEPTYISLNRFTPYPGTKIWQDYYKNKNIRFGDLFQLNKVVKLRRDIDNYVEKMFKDIELYNKERNEDYK